MGFCAAMERQYASPDVMKEGKKKGEEKDINEQRRADQSQH